MTEIYKCTSKSSPSFHRKSACGLIFRERQGVKWWKRQTWRKWQREKNLSPWANLTLLLKEIKQFPEGNIKMRSADSAFVHTHSLFSVSKESKCISCQASSSPTSLSQFTKILTMKPYKLQYVCVCVCVGAHVFRVMCDLRLRTVHVCVCG